MRSVKTLSALLGKGSQEKFPKFLVGVGVEGKSAGCMARCSALLRIAVRETHGCFPGHLLYHAHAHGTENVYEIFLLASVDGLHMDGTVMSGCPLN